MINEHEPKRFYWHKKTWQRRAEYWLFDSPKGTSRTPCGGCSTKGRDGVTAHIFGGSRPDLFAIAGNHKTAMKRLEAEIDKQSIGLFGVDDVEFVHEN